MRLDLREFQSYRVSRLGYLHEPSPDVSAVHHLTVRRSLYSNGLAPAGFDIDYAFGNSYPTNDVGSPGITVPGGVARLFYSDYFRLIYILPLPDFVPYFHQLRGRFGFVNVV